MKLALLLLAACAVHPKPDSMRDVCTELDGGRSSGWVQAGDMVFYCYGDGKVRP